MGYYKSDTTDAVANDLRKAVDSIPGYVGRSALFLVLAPLCMHRDRRVPCSFATWRLEFATVAILAQEPFWLKSNVGSN